MDKAEVRAEQKLQQQKKGLCMEEEHCMEAQQNTRDTGADGRQGGVHGGVQGSPSDEYTRAISLLEFAIKQAQGLSGGEDLQGGAVNEAPRGGGMQAEQRVEDVRALLQRQLDEAQRVLDGLGGGA